VNDLAVCGAKAVAISCGLILEEGLPTEILERALAAMRAAAKEAGVTIACGDTKVVERGKGTGSSSPPLASVLRWTAGAGPVGDPPRRPDPAHGDDGDHQVAVLIARQNLAISAPVLSDVAPLSDLLLPLLPRFAGKVRFMRDPTRGGVGVTLNEMSSTANARFTIDEARLPVRESVRGVCEILGFDPLYLANEGKAVLIVAGMPRMRSSPRCGSTRTDGRRRSSERLQEGGCGVRMRTLAGGVRAVDYPVGDQLPRIC